MENSCLGFATLEQRRPAVASRSPRRSRGSGCDGGVAGAGEVGQGPGGMTRARNKSHRDEALWQVYQLNVKTAADDRSEQRRNVTRALAVIVVTLLALGGLMIWAAWL
jgi:hypothetical protein